MTNRLFKNWLTAALCVLALGSTVAMAEPDSFGLGTGRNGALSIVAPTTGAAVVNSYAPVLAPLAPGDTSISVGTCTGSATCFAAGDLVMVFQTTGIVPVPVSGGTATIDLTNDAVGRWEFARLSAVTASTMTLTAGLVNSYAASVTQVIRVPEYTTVTLTSGGGRSLTAAAWNGSTGGILAFLAQGTVSNTGTMTALGLGFRGGSYLDDDATNLGCSDLDEAAQKGAQKGEGISNVSYGATHTGRGNVANGAGGGVCYKSGGGGGGNYGTGGVGGRSDGLTDSARTVGGLGGTALTYAMVNHMTFGGGGGAGHGEDSSGNSGGAGGGIIFIRAGTLTGTGTINASGAQGGSASADGASGGGAGGSIYLRLSNMAACGAVSAIGGTGGNPGANRKGPGGGGGGGRVLFQASGGACGGSISVNGASNGNQPDGTATDGTAYGATAGSNGIVTTLTGGLVVPTTAPTVTTPANGSFTKEVRPNITGTATANRTVVVYIDGKEVGRTTSTAASTFLLMLTSDLTDGLHTVYATEEVDALQGPKSLSNNFTVDATPPAAPVVVTPANGSSTNNNKPAITGTAEANSTVTVYLNGTVVGTTTANASGAWTFTPTTALSDGTYAAKATATDALGNVSVDSNTNLFRVDTIPPTAPVVVTPANNSVTNNNKPAITGTAEANSTVTVYLNGTVVGTTTANGSGAWTFTPTTALADGTYAAKATAKDAAGNVSVDSNINTFRVDTTPPAAPVVVTPANGSVTNNNKPAITGTAEANSTVTVYLNGSAVGTTTANGSGAWTFTPTTALTDGTYAAKVTATDAAGNVSVDSNTNTFRVDTVPPAAPVVVTPANGSVTNNNKPAITGTAEANSTVTVYLNGSAVGTTTANGSGAWTFTPATALTDGTYAAKATSTDAAGNISVDSNTNTFTVDATPPPAPVVVTPANGSVTNNPKPAITGTAEANSTVTVYLNGTAVGTTTANAAGNWTFTPTTALTDGTYAAKSTSKDAAGNVSVDSNTNTFTRGHGASRRSRGGDARQQLGDQ